MNPDPICLIAIGSNLGDSVANIQRAFEELQNISAFQIQKSSLWRSTPVDCPPDSPDFINAAAAFEPLENETAESLLTKLQQLESKFGRRPKAILNEARSLDLDLIAFKNETRNTQFLALPHPRFHQRRFVLAPLNELAPQMVLPGQTQTVGQLLEALDTDESVTLISTDG
ncbi:MAG: 2-amino-4-hydroxy-6-hydroxymethyldihydropteridine diphosphokinase [Verrucomicrobia subdivision 3 bacterium]|nr:2-amino-4-hydroxy-6-hydroxymethyldihydropteridine diphosphokinase [Limisphaerales bacterium]